MSCASGMDYDDILKTDIGMKMRLAEWGCDVMTRLIVRLNYASHGKSSPTKSFHFLRLAFYLFTDYSQSSTALFS